MDGLNTREKNKETVLYVDDEPHNLTLFHEFMKENYHVLVTDNTTKAHELLKQNPVKVLIADLRMPKESGLEFIQRISPDFPFLMKIILTAHADHESAMQALNQGDVYKYVLKPWEYTLLKESIDNAIREHDLKVENANLMKQLKSKNSILEKAFIQIRESEKKYTGIFRASIDGIVLIKDHQVLEVNPAFLDIIGVQENEFSRQKMKEFLEQKMPQIFCNQHDCCPDGQEIKEVELSRGKQSKKHLELNCRSFDLSGEELRLAIVRDITEKKQVEQRIIEAIFETEEKDRAEYAQELHDGLGPILSTLKMYVEWLCNDSSPVNKELIKINAMQAIDEAIVQVKEIANQLSPHVLQRFGMVNALQNYCDWIKETQGLQISIHSNLQERLPTGIETMFYRILLECINNSIKHAAPRSISIRLERVANNIEVVYQDKGKGFDVERTMQETKGLGLFSMQNRIRVMGGEIRINSVIGEGTQVFISISI